MHNVVNALGWMLVHLLWQACLVVGAFWMVHRLAPSRAANLRYVAGLAAYLAIITFPAVTLWMYLAPGAGGQGVATAVSLPALGVATGYPVTAESLLHHALEPAMPAIVILWALGVALMAARTAVGWYGARQLVRCGVEAVDAPVRQLAERLRLEMGVRRAVTVLRSTRVAVPTVVGWLDPVVLLPVSVLARLPREQLTLVLAHELAHVRRNDYLVNLLQLVVETLFFYHPAIGWLGRRVREDREHCCDDEVVAAFGERVAYARALASLEQLRAPASPALAATGGDLYHRVDRIVHCEPPRRSSGFAQVALVAALAVAAGVGVKQGAELGADLERVRLTATPATVIEPLPDALAGALGQGALRHERRQAEREQRRRRALAAEAERVARDRAAREAEPQPKRIAALATQPPPPVAASDTPLALVVTRDRAVSPDVFLPEQLPGDELLLAAVTPAPAVELAPPPSVKQVLEAVDAPEVLKQVSPDYPYKAHRNGLEGQVRLEFTLDPRGRPRQVQVVQSRPAGVFDKAAVKAMEKWRFAANPSRDGSTRYLQVFDFTRPDDDTGRRYRRCNRTGSNICGGHYDQANVRRFAPDEHD